MSVRTVSTAVSDFVLAGCSFYSAFSVYERSIYAVWGFTSVAVAASFGVLKFGVVFPSIQSKVVRLHVLFTWLASVVGIPLIAAGFCVYHHKPANANFHLFSSVAAVFLSLVHTPLEDKLTLLVSTVAVFGILFVTFMSSNFCATAGALAYGLASAVKSIDFLGFPGVDWFHYILAGANFLLMHGLITTSY